MATNAYSHKLGFFKNRVIPIAVFQIATAPLSPVQWENLISRYSGKQLLDYTYSDQGRP